MLRKETGREYYHMKNDILALTSYNIPVQTILVRKVGALYLKNLFYYFDRFKLPKNPHDLDDNKGLNFEKPLPRIDPLAEVRFVLFRNPLDRLVAFYFDELFYESERVWNDWREVLKKRGAKIARVNSQKEHQANILILLKYIEELTAKTGLIGLPDHLAPQYKFVLPAIDRGFQPVDIIRANFELSSMLEPYIDHPEKTLAKIEKKVKPITPYDARDVVNKEALALHRKIYEADFELYWAYRYGAS